VKKHSIVLTVLVVAAAACTGSSSSEPEVTAPPPATADNGATTTGSTPPLTTGSTPPSEASAPPISTEPPASSAEPVESSTSTAVDEAFFPDDLGPRVESVPGVDVAGEIVELSEMVWLFVPSEADESDANVVVPLPEDAEIITAYGRAMSALYGQVTMSPIPVEPTDSMSEAFLDGGAKYSENVFASRSAAGEHLGFPDGGDVLRPVVLADPRSDDEAFIFDCAISRSKYLTADGSLAAGETGGEVLAPLIVRLVRVEGEWIVDDIQDDERACA